MAGADRYEDILAMNPMVVGPRNAVRFAADVNGKLWQSVKGTTYIPLIPDPLPVATVAGTLAFPGLATIPNLKAWFDASKGVAFGTWPAVATLADQSGLGNNLTGVGSPTLVANSINGRPGISCVPATPSYLRNTANTLVATDRGARTVFFVGKSRSVIGGAAVTFRSGVANIFSFEFLTQGGTALFFYASGGASNGTGVYPGSAINGVPTVFEFSYDGQFATAGAVNSTVRVKANGVEQAMLAGGGFSVAESGTAGFCIGTREDATTLGWDGEFSEVLIFDRSLTPAERLLIQRYLALKYTITCTSKINTMCLGDSHFFGTGDATSIASGGPRQELFALHSSLILGVGEFYSPLGTSSSPTTDGNWNRCEGNVGFQSGSGGTGIGGANLVRYIAANPADLFLLMIGTNDGPDLGGLTAAQTATNIRAIVDYIYAQLPASKVIVIRSPLGDTTHAANNAVVLQQGPATETALVGAPNVLRNPALATSALAGGAVITPVVLADSLYVPGDHIHLLPAGWHQIIAAGGTTTGLGLDAELRVRGV